MLTNYHFWFFNSNKIRLLTFVIPLWVLGSESALMISLYLVVKTQSHLAEHILSTNYSYTDTFANLEILHIINKGPKLNTTKEHEIYRHSKDYLSQILNSQLQCSSNTLFDSIITLNPNSNQKIHTPITS